MSYYEHIHNLSMIAKKAQLDDVMSEEQKNLIDLLEPLNIEARYPTVKDQIKKKYIQKILPKAWEFI